MVLKRLKEFIGRRLVAGRKTLSQDWERIIIIIMDWIVVLFI